MNSGLKKILTYSFNVFLVVSVILAFIAIDNQTYFYGWLAGSLASVGGFLLSFLISSKFGIGITSKAYGFLIGFTRTIIVLLFHGLYLFMIMAINTHFSNPKSWFTLSTIINPINFFTYLVGIFLIPAGTITWGIRSIWKDKNAKICKRV